MTERSGVFGRYRRWVEKGFEEFCAYDGEELKRKNRRVLLTTYMAAVLGAALILFLNGPGFFTFLAMAFAAFVLLKEIPGAVLGGMRNGFFLKLLGYLSAVRKKYMNLGNIPEAVKEAALDQCAEIRHNADEIEELLLAGNRREKVRKYVGEGPRNRFLKLFLIQAYEASEYGDASGEKEGSMFAENVELLRREIIGEIYNSKKKSFMFSGYMTVAVLPTMVFSLVRKAGVSFSENMKEFYDGSGRAVLLLAFLTAFFVCMLVAETKGTGREKQGGFHMPAAAAVALDGLNSNEGAACRAIKKLVHETNGEENVAAVVFRMLAAVLGTCLACIIGGILGLNHGIVILLILSLISGTMPFMALLYRKAAFKTETSEEIKRMQTVILMERKLESMTVINLLSDLELFADAFKPEIRECINMWSFGPQKALMGLKEKGKIKNREFETIADSFLAVDEVGISEAFSDTASNRECLVKIEELESSIRQESRKNLMDIIAWIPGSIMLGGYFIIPFLFVTVREIEEMFKLFDMF